MLGKIRSWVRKRRDFTSPGLRGFIAAAARETPPGSRVLDAGAGESPYRPLFAHCEYVAQDFAANPCKVYGPLDLISDITAIPAPDASFDVIVCTEVLEHVFDPRAALKEFARLLKPGGRLVLTVPLCAGIHEPPYVFYGGFTPYWIQRALPEAGFHPPTIEPNRGFPAHLANDFLIMPSLVLRKPGDSKGMFGFKSILLAAITLLQLPLVVILLAVDRFDAHPVRTFGYLVSSRRQ